MQQRAMIWFGLPIIDKPMDDYDKIGTYQGTK